MAKYIKQDKQNTTIPLMGYHLQNIESALLSLNSAFIGASYNNNILKLTKLDGTTVSFDLSTSGGSSSVEGVAYELCQGAWVVDGYSSNHNNRVCTTELIPGNFTVKVNDGYVIRAVYSYASIEGGSANMVADTSTSRTEYTSNDSSLFYGVTFAKTDANATMSPTEDIVKEWVTEP